MIKKNEQVIITIDDIGTKGEGIGKYEGYTLFVKDTAIGDKVLVKVMKTGKNYGYARLVEIIEPSADRVKPRCPIADKCGGCQIMHINYAKQLEYKEEKLRNCLTRIGGFTDIPMEPICGMDDPYYYRNKSQFPVGKDKEGKVVIGFYAGRTHSIIDTDHCYIGAKENVEIIRFLRSFIEKCKLEPYDEVNHRGLVRHILTRVAYTTGEIMVCLVINGDDIPHKKELIEGLSKINGMKSICLNINRKKTNVILGDRIVPIWGEAYITDNIGPIKYRISPLSFFQINPIQTEKLYNIALDYANLSGNEVVWDLYCGIGTISLFLAQRAKMVYGVEIVAEAIDDARTNAKINGIENVEFYVGAAEEVLPKKYKEDNISADLIVVDPPRKGCDQSLLDTILDIGPEKIVYVSCDPGTLARDLKYLCESKYELKKVRVVDQFGHSVHVETVVLLSQLRQKPDDYIDVDVDVAELEGTSAETKATYEKIKKYVAEHNDGMKVSSLYIAQVKRKCGIELVENFNLPKSEESRQPQCPKEKEEAIIGALKAFKMI